MLNVSNFGVSIVAILLQLLSEINASECGKAVHIETRIVGGSEISRGAWPFIAALYYTKKSKFFCGATLISRKNVLTAAHCVQRKGSADILLAEDVVVLLGKHSLSEKIEKGVQQKDVNKIDVHPDWNAFSDRFDADLAVLRLNEHVDYTIFVQPVCLPADDDNVINGVKGSIVGWGLSERETANMHENIPREAITSVLNDSYCYTTNHFIALFSSARTFCGGGEGGFPNTGDSGGGFFVFSNSAAVQYGIISSSLTDATGRVVADSMAIYTNIKFFTQWLAEIVKMSGEEVMTLSRSMEKIDLTCLYNIFLTMILHETDESSEHDVDVDRHLDSVKGRIERNQLDMWIYILTFTSIIHPYHTIYECELWNLDITRENLEVASIRGHHIGEYNLRNVTDIWFRDGTLTYIPNGFGRFFPNLKKIWISYDDANLGLKLLRRSNFQNMTTLWHLDVKSNDIQTVDEETLWDLPNLKNFIIKKNKLEVLHKDTFARNADLVFVNANSNQLQFLHSDLFKMNLRLEQATFSDNKLVTILVDFTKLLGIKMIDFHGNICIDRDLKDVDTLTDYQSLLRNQCAAHSTT